MSTISPNPNPLAPPSGARLPANPALALVVGLPSTSLAQPRGMSRPSAAACLTLTLAVALVAMSTMMGSPLARGAPKPMGLVPKNGRFPPNGATDDGALAKARLTSPCRASKSLNQPTTPAE